MPLHREERRAMTKHRGNARIKFDTNFVAKSKRELTQWQ
jgi:hypothetical protein